ncbi:hypothetical protein NNJEOMEG_02608 [Fundidesulfovibrio magnetotacticus]|uniref:Uncharacterized protein n=1 Tax=Fundidesulfovibrio magnetotacticus TaxID=2730080 RepID=A0A6V8LVY7_9BACT|nr:hypothetical protein [Fundidesulfovibrio magnetotacticus]GFK94761.1 hypothetical protein NNJEOMEG_02608 [Fundidesulfovibrio magnetotacticus]
MPARAGRPGAPLAARPTLSIRHAGGETRSAELFPAVDFPGGENATERYRVRIGRAWHMPGGQKYAFVTVDEAWALLMGRKAPQEAARPPKLPVGTWVRAPSTRLPDGTAMYTRCATRTKPFQGADGRWRVVCYALDEPVLVEELKVEVRL